MKIITIAVVAIAALAVAVPAFSALLMNEPFSYADGNLTVVSGGLWKTHSGTTGPIQVLGGKAIVVQTPSEDDNRIFGTRLATDKTYVSFEATVDPASASGENYFFHLKDSGLNFRARVYVTAIGGGLFKFGLSTTSGAMDKVWATSLTLGVKYTVVISYDASTGFSELWVDPVSEGDAKLLSSTAGAGGIALEAVALRQSSGVFTVAVDNIQVGDTFIDVLGGGTATAGTTWGGVKALYR